MFDSPPGRIDRLSLGVRTVLFEHVAEGEIKGSDPEVSPQIIAGFPILEAILEVVFGIRAISFQV